jgi:DNA-binding response OmpR family regulator
MVMPEMSGLQLQQQLRKLRPALPALLMSSFSEEAITCLGGRGRCHPLIEKPFTIDGILAKVRDLLAAGVSDD